ncbi:MAG: HAMP domain-containing sensor histidine kinase [Chitinophagaceae bacterium]
MHPIYDRLSRIGFLSRSYTFKFLFVAFLGIHIPLIGLIVFVLFHPGVVSTGFVLFLTLLLTLSATAITLLVLNGLLSPLRQSRHTLQDYLDKGHLPELPTHYTDEAGQLMQHIQFTLTDLNNLLEEKKDLTALLSHDLRIPLRNVQTFAEIMQQQQLSEEEVKQMAGIIIDSTKEQQQLLNNILEILRMDYLFKNGMARQPFSVLELITDSLQSVAPAAEAKKIRITTIQQYTGDVEVEPELFKQVLRNLLSNAIKFSHQGASIQVRIYREAEQTMIEVIDEGIGFDAKIAENIFDRFTVAGRKGTAGEPTVGMGLYLSQKIIRHQQGELYASSEGEGKGATFTICLN